jgi:hypothetical protein
VEEVTVTRTAWAELNTEFHYAVELVKVLKRLRDLTFDFSPPGIHGHAPEEAVFYLREATRCFLYGLFEASVALCRACLEEALDARLHASAQGIEALMREPKQIDGKKRGKLEVLIGAGTAAKILDCPLKDSASRIQKLGNTVMHDRRLLSEDEARDDLRDLRTVLNSLFAP